MVLEKAPSLPLLALTLLLPYESMTPEFAPCSPPLLPLIVELRTIMPALAPLAASPLLPLLVAVTLSISNVMPGAVPMLTLATRTRHRQ
jgi:hypothetical protein